MPFSISSSRCQSPNVSETMQIFVKNVAGETFPMTVPADASIRNLTTLLSVRTYLPESDLRLVYAGRHLSSSSTLASNNINRDATLHMAMPLRGGMPPKKIRCTYKDCKQGAQRVIGDCGFCNGHYCGTHRLLEDHKCDGLEDVSSPSPPRDPEWWLVGLDEELWANVVCDAQCKKESHDRNAAQLNAERTQVIKGI
ncbi:related to ubiquitin [Rhynchosporium secalis]|uniref:Related to ubiquitin n=1 Tax=Rhynchosporium secalis TaxID=38038 RepID=A0A1E1M585_RHYSE|nr:related to ubiquitin [Rhynchosporium secalis]